MTINCYDIESFLEVVSGLVKRGLTFTADAGTFKITLLGGF